MYDVILYDALSFTYSISSENKIWDISFEKFRDVHFEIEHAILTL